MGNRVEIKDRCGLRLGAAMFCDSKEYKRRESVEVLLRISISSLLELPVSSWTTFFATALRLNHMCPGVSNTSCSVQLFV